MPTLICEFVPAVELVCVGVTVVVADGLDVGVDAGVTVVVSDGLDVGVDAGVGVGVEAKYKKFKTAYPKGTMLLSPHKFTLAVWHLT